jgi:hypothetical protein
MTQLNSTEIRALREALEDEYLSWATYDQVVRDFGEVRPFVNIREAEARHIAALRRLFQTYGLDIPDNPWPGKAARYGSLQEACEAGVTAEISNGEMYERLLSATERPGILAVFRKLQEASQQRHLPAFRRGAQRGGGTGRGCGGGRRQRDGRGCATA